MLGIIYVHNQFPPGESTLNLVLFSVCAAALAVGSVVSIWLLATRWSVLTPGERWRAIFYAVFL